MKKQHTCKFKNCPCIVGIAQLYCVSKSLHRCNHLRPPVAIYAPTPVEDKDCLCHCHDKCDHHLTCGFHNPCVHCDPPPLQ